MKQFVLAGLVWLLSEAISFAGTPSPISVTEIARHDKQQVSAEVAARVAARIIGSSVFATANPRLVRYQDRAAMGSSPDGTAWLVRGAVKLESREAVAVNAMIDASTGKLVFACTDSTGDWPAPMEGATDLASVVKQAGWVLGTVVPDSLQSSMIQVMETACHQHGSDPTETGQLVIRPRWNSPRFPARTEGQELIPIRGAAKVWIIQVCGRKRPTPGPMPTDGEAPIDYYSTEEFLQLKDGSLEFWGGFSYR